MNNDDPAVDPSIQWQNKRMNPGDDDGFDNNKMEIDLGLLSEDSVRNKHQDFVDQPPKTKWRGNLNNLIY